MHNFVLLNTAEFSAIFNMLIISLQGFFLYN
nr:MAG TPA: hypothetical protein [Caudoviricetes sp.]